MAGSISVLFVLSYLYYLLKKNYRLPALLKLCSHHLETADMQHLQKGTKQTGKVAGTRERCCLCIQNSLCADGEQLCRPVSGHTGSLQTDKQPHDRPMDIFLFDLF